MSVSRKSCQSRDERIRRKEKFDLARLAQVFWRLREKVLQGYGARMSRYAKLQPWMLPTWYIYSVLPSHTGESERGFAEAEISALLA